MTNTVPDSGGETRTLAGTARSWLHPGTVVVLLASGGVDDAPGDVGGAGGGGENVGRTATPGGGGSGFDVVVGHLALLATAALGARRR